MFKRLRHRYYKKRTQYNYAIGGLTISGLLLMGLWAFTSFPLYPLWLTAVSTTTLGLYAVDKMRAGAGRRNRIPEIVLHAFALLGGGPGALVGILMLRHKSNFARHPAFILIAIAATAGHGALLWWIQS